ncbi:flagellar biosynthetic protein FliO [Massilia aurea]|uniref:flagellar biosynthetic protein FliO n=1 Tax=Massilia aurea TaxID=373040 RepID=UPI0034622A9F
MISRRAAAQFVRTNAVSVVAALLMAPALVLAQNPPASDTTTGRPAAPAVPAPSTVPAVTPPPVAALPGDAAVTAEPPATTAPPTTTTAPAPAPAIKPLRPAPQVALPASNGPGAAGLLQTIFALLLVLGLLIGLAWLLKRYGPKPGGGMANLRVVGALNLGGRERIMVVEVGDQWIVVGAAPGRVNALHTMPRQDLDLGSGTSAAPGGMPATRFADWLKHTMDKRNAS